MTGNTLLVCDKVVKRFGALAAVADVSMQVNEGEIVGIGGPNGAGKTTLFDVITGVTPLSQGKVLFEGRDISGMTADRICQAGLARTFQFNAAFDHLSVKENVELAAYFGRYDRALPGLRIDPKTRHIVEEWLDFVGLSSKADIVVSDLPVLDRKLLMIAGAMATKPRILFLDEPVGGLNTHEIDHILELVSRMRASGLTIVLIEHVMRFLLALSSRVIILHHGSVIFEGKPHQVAEDETVVETYLGQGTKDRLQKFFNSKQTAVATE
jgi:branched-chain amino acid transport system ATP-binding protein